MLKRTLLAGALLVAVATSALPAAAASAPSASTGPVTSVGPTTASVSGSVNPNGTSTSWYVEYGTSTSYGSKTASASAGSGTSSVSISPTLTGLAPGTSYHYRVVATSSAGTGRGADGLLTTSAAPQVVTGSASGVTTSSAALNGTVNPSSRSTNWYFEYGTSTSYGSKTSTKNAGSGTSPVAVSAPVSGLSSGHAYHFRLVATSDAGTSRGNDSTFVASARPSATTKGSSSVKDTSANLNAIVNANGLSTSIVFEYGTSTSYGSKTTAKNIGSGTGSTTIQVPVSGLGAATVYHVRVVASNSAGTTAGNDVTFTTTGHPLARTDAATGATANGATLTGVVDPNGHAASWYFQYGATTAYGQQTPAHSASTGGGRSVAETIGSLAPATAYHYRLVATNSAGTGYGADGTFRTAGPAVTMAVSTTIAISRRGVTLGGKVASGRSNESVTVFEQRYGAPSFTAFATVLTGAGGTWSLIVRPAIGTTYKSVWNGSTSSTVSVSVRPAVTLRVLKRARFTTHVLAAGSFAGRTVQLQRRLPNGRWLTIARKQLNRHSSAAFHPALRRGRWTLRVAISINQAGRGYLAGFSTWISVRRT